MWKSGCGACPKLVHPMRIQLMDVGAESRSDIVANDDDSTMRRGSHSGLRRLRERLLIVGLVVRDARNRSFKTNIDTQTERLELVARYIRTVRTFLACVVVQRRWDGNLLASS
jgi:hypothetical protein